MTNEAFCKKLRAAIKASGMSMSKWAIAHGLRKQFVSSVLTGKKPPTRTLLEILGYEREINIRPRRKA